MSLETILAGHTILRRLRTAKAAGYAVELRYVALDLVALNIQRVQARVARGGHPIALDVIRRRYGQPSRSLVDRGPRASHRQLWSDPSAGVGDQPRTRYQSRT